MKATQNVLDTTYGPRELGSRSNPAGFARAMLVLGLAHAGLGHLDEAAAAGRQALDTTDVVWPTRVLAEQLHDALDQDAPPTTEIDEYRSAYARTASSPVRPLPPGPEGTP